MKFLSKEELDTINGGTGVIQAIGAGAKHVKCAIDDFALRAGLFWHNFGF